jgi:hypothetical protein
VSSSTRVSLLFLAPVLLEASLVQPRALAQTDVSGTVSGTWTVANSPYRVVSDIQVATLTIEPGVTVTFAGDYVFTVAGVLTASGTEAQPIVFTADSPASWKGILFQNSNPGSQLSYCSVTNANSSGIRVIESLPFLSHCTITNCQSGSSGGGLYLSLTIPGDLLIADCTISHNQAPSAWPAPVSHAGGIYVAAGNGTVRLERCTIANNTASMSDGHVLGGGGFAVGNVEFSSCAIRANLVTGNEGIPGGSSAGRGGGLFIDGGGVSFTNCLIVGNTASGHAPGGMQGNQGYASGGGIHVDDGVVTLRNSIVADNIVSSSHGSQGAGTFANAGELDVQNCTLIGNNLWALDRSLGTVIVINSIVYFNNSDASQLDSSITVTYSDVQGGFPGTGNINFNPVLDVMACREIAAGSPCIDMGDPDPAYNDACFPPSLGGYRNDMGAHGGPAACGWICPPVTPVLLSGFAAMSRWRAVELSWFTSFEYLHDGFNLYRSNALGGNFARINNGLIRGRNPYSYIDSTVDPSTIYFYRLGAVDLSGVEELHNPISVTTPAWAIRPSLTPGAPNPFAKRTTLAFTLPTAEEARVVVYDVTGRHVTTVVDEKLPEGEHTATWDGRDHLGHRVAGGTYFVRLHAGGETTTRKVVFLGD